MLAKRPKTDTAFLFFLRIGNTTLDLETLSDQFVPIQPFGQSGQGIGLFRFEM